MEDFLQIIIVIIFILSAISSSRKKKDKSNIPNSEKQKLSKPNFEPNKNRNLPKTGTQVLEEILGFKLELPESQKSEIPNYSTDNLPTLESRNLDYENYDSEKSLEEINDGNEDNYSEKYLTHKSEIKSLKEKHSSFKDKVIIGQEKNQPNRFAKLLEEKNNLKNFIVVQEILSKPKALRK
ncbi:MAG: hypothetical protein IPM32_15020 [Ignavibacteriae bacterium]|nr:hypothetical protein [Ignavibacteriota bacterium]